LTPVLIDATLKTGGNNMYRIFSIDAKIFSLEEAILRWKDGQCYSPSSDYDEGPEVHGYCLNMRTDEERDLSDFLKEILNIKGHNKRLMVGDEFCGEICLYLLYETETLEEVNLRNISKAERKLKELKLRRDMLEARKAKLPDVDIFEGE
jgi:hypothetical protein